MARSKKGKGKKGKIVQPASPPPPDTDQEEMNVAADDQARARSPTPPLPDPAQSDDGEQSEGDMPPAKKDKKSVHLTMEQEEAVIEWLKQHEVIFNIKLGGFRQTKLKAAAWGELAETLGLTVEDVQLWYRNMRTQLGKLKTKLEKSGGGTTQLTDRQRWQWDHKHFLVEHIRRKVVRRELRPLPPSTSTSQASMPASQPTSTESPDESDVPTMPAPPPAQTPVTRQPIPPRQRSRSRTPSDMPDDVMTVLAGTVEKSSERADALLKLTQALLQTRQGNRELRTFSDWVYETLLIMPPDAQDDCREELTGVINRWKRSVRQPQHAQQQQQPDHQQQQPHHVHHMQPPQASSPVSASCSQISWQPPPKQWPARSEEDMRTQPSVFNSMECDYVQKQQQQFRQLSTPKWHAGQGSSEDQDTSQVMRPRRTPSLPSFSNLPSFGPDSPDLALITTLQPVRQSSADVEQQLSLSDLVRNLANEGPGTDAAGDK